MLIVEYVINHDKRLRKIRTNIETMSVLKQRLKDKHKTEDVEIKFITSEY